jgi:hypothetical protein
MGQLGKRKRERERERERKRRGVEYREDVTGMQGKCTSVVGCTAASENVIRQEGGISIGKQVLYRLFISDMLNGRLQKSFLVICYFIA